MTGPTRPIPDRDREPTDEIGELVRAAASTVHAPPSLRAHVAQQRLRAGARGRRPRVELRSRALVPALAALAAAVVVALALLPGGGADQPSVASAADLALSRPTAAAPPVARKDREHIAASVGGVAFPNYAYETPWRTAGVRRDRLAGRTAMTVVYRSGRGSVGYTIVDGAPLAWPAGARWTTYRGVRVAIARRADATIVVWRRGGHTCVLASRQAPADVLVRFASWT